ncbi:MAG: c-type cytochrome [Candidatus Rokubacteria bacterium]|nr:c-type cytochrome [Candidatus Rokubacteria bacterium]
MPTRNLGPALAAALVTLALAAPAAPAAEPPVERGRYLVEVLAACGNCHTPKGPAGDLPGKHLAGGGSITEEFGTAIASNITPDRTTGIGGWRDAEIVRAIREGKSKSGRTLGPPMPFELYRQLSDTDVTAIVAYLRSVKPVRNRVAKSRYTMPLPPSWGPPVTSVPDPPQEILQYGAYLAGPIAHCVECHTPPGPGGRRDDARRLFAGGRKFTGPWGVTYSANLTTDRETGLGEWTTDQIVAGINGLRRDGSPERAPMPWPYYAGRIADRDMRALVAYLKSLPPIRSVVPPAEPPKPPEPTRRRPGR